MANFYTDSHGERWGVMMQEKKMSCGPACVAMTEVDSKSRVEANMEQIAREISQKYEGRFEEDTGSTLPNLAVDPAKRGVPCYDAYNFGGGAVWSYLYAYAKDAAPTICHVQWSKGGHFVVCIKVYKDNHRCVFLDPLLRAGRGCRFEAADLRRTGSNRHIPAGRDGEVVRLVIDHQGQQVAYCRFARALSARPQAISQSARIKAAALTAADRQLRPLCFFMRGQRRSRSASRGSWQ